MLLILCNQWQPTVDAELIEVGGIRCYFGAGGTLEGSNGFELDRLRSGRMKAAEATREFTKLGGDIGSPRAYPGMNTCGCCCPPFGCSGDVSCSSQFRIRLWKR